LFRRHLTMYILLVGLSAAALLSALSLAPVLATVVKDFLIIDRAIVRVDQEDEEIAAFLRTGGVVPKDGSGGAFGYGLLTEAGFDGVIVTTTHAGVRDSEVQDDASDPVFHNHYVELATGLSGLCEGPEVADLTFESPGDVNVLRRLVVMNDLPFSFSGTSALTDEPLTITPGGNVEDVVSFTLEPKFDNEGNLDAVCVNDIRSAERLNVIDDEGVRGLPSIPNTDATEAEGAANNETADDATAIEEPIIPEVGSEEEEDEEEQEVLDELEEEENNAV
jgi:hypothetical protein